MVDDGGHGGERGIAYLASLVLQIGVCEVVLLQAADVEHHLVLLHQDAARRARHLSNKRQQTPVKLMTSKLTSLLPATCTCCLWL